MCVFCRCVSIFRARSGPAREKERERWKRSEREMDEEGGTEKDKWREREREWGYPDCSLVHSRLIPGRSRYPKNVAPLTSN